MIHMLCRRDNAHHQKAQIYRGAGEILRRKESLFFRQRFPRRRCSDVPNSLTRTNTTTKTNRKFTGRTSAIKRSYRTKIRKRIKKPGQNEKYDRIKTKNLELTLPLSPIHPIAWTEVSFLSLWYMSGVKVISVAPLANPLLLCLSNTIPHAASRTYLMIGQDLQWKFLSVILIPEGWKILNSSFKKNWQGAELGTFDGGGGGTEEGGRGWRRGEGGWMRGERGRRVLNFDSVNIQFW